MSIADRLFSEKRERVNTAHPRDPMIAQIFGLGTNTAAGVYVDPDSALRLSAVYACVRILSSAIASLPLDLYRRRENGGREKVSSHPLYSVLHDQPNRWQTSFEYREMQAAHLLMRGNAYARIVSGPTAPIRETVPLHPDRVRPFWAPDGAIAYAYQPPEGEPVVFLQDEIHHIRGMSLDGLVGLSPLEYTRETIGLTKAAEEFGGRFFGNGTTLGGVIEHPNQLSDKAYERLKESWAERHQGTANAHKPAILEEGTKWHSMGIPPEQAQFLETRKFQISEIARIYGVPPHMLADVEKSTSWGSGIEHQGIGFVVYSLRPWLVRFEQAIKRDLLTTQSTRRMFAEFNVDGLLRGDSKARAEYYDKMFRMGTLNQNEIRAKENMNPIDGGEKYYVPLNMVDIQTGEQTGEEDGN